MMEYSPIFKRALGAVWTAGYRPNYAEKSEIRRACGYSVNIAEIMRNNGAESAIRALETVGYPVASDPDLRGFDLVRPLPFIPDSVPMAGHLVRLRGPWSIMNAGDLAGLQGRIGERRRGFTIANARGGWHCGMNPDRDNYLSMGNGGPASIVELDSRVLHWTGETGRLRAWSWVESPQANGGANFLLTVPVWEWQPAADGSDFLAWESDDAND